MYAGHGLGDLAPAVSFVNKTSSARLYSPAVGDQWSLTVTGPANSPVVVTGGQNGVNVPAAMGSTDAQGSYTVSGAFTADQIGHWSEDWQVGGKHAGTIQFTVSPAAAGGGGQQALNPGNGAAINPDAPGVPLGPDYPAAAASALANIPTTVLYGLGAIAVLLMFGGRGRR